MGGSYQRTQRPAKLAATNGAGGQPRRIERSRPNVVPVTARSLQLVVKHFSSGGLLFPAEASRLARQYIGPVEGPEKEPGAR